MGAPVVAGGIWAYRAWQAWRAARALAAAHGPGIATATVVAGGTQMAIEGARENAQATSVPHAGECVQCGPPNDPCRTGRFDELECESGEHRHHIISDYIIRAGRRLETATRLPGAPSLGEGPSICLDPDTHRTIHRNMDARVAALGSSGTLADVKRIAMEEIEAAKPECASKLDDIRQQLEDAFQNMGDDAPVRTSPRLPSAEDAIRLMEQNTRNGGFR
jgi:hypothetical protein